MKITHLQVPIEVLRICNRAFGPRHTTSYPEQCWSNVKQKTLSDVYIFLSIFILTFTFISDATWPLDVSFRTSSRSPISRAMFDQSSNFSWTKAVSRFSLTLQIKVLKHFSKLLHINKGIIFEFGRKDHLDIASVKKGNNSDKNLGLEEDMVPQSPLSGYASKTAVNYLS